MAEKGAKNLVECFVFNKGDLATIVATSQAELFQIPRRERSYGLNDIAAIGDNATLNRIMSLVAIYNSALFLDQFEDRSIVTCSS